MSLNYNYTKEINKMLFSLSDMGRVKADGVWLPAVLHVV